jgi:hypothetical protein
MAKTRPLPSLSDEQRTRLLELLSGTDTVELKLTLPEADHRSAAAALGMDPLDAQIRQVFFFDTPELTLNKRGLVVRARRIQGKGADTVVKLRPVGPGDLPRSLRKLPEFGVEVDMMPGGFVCSASLKGVAGIDEPREVAAGTRPIRKLFSKAQRAFFTEHAPAGMNLNDLALLGPITVFKLRFRPRGFGRRMVAELWMYPDNSKVLELSTKCLPEEAAAVAAESRAFLESRGVDLTGDQQTKTKSALQFFAAHLQDGKKNGARAKRIPTGKPARRKTGAARKRATTARSDAQT